MRNYYDTQKELELIKLRLDALHTQKESLRSLVEPKSVVTDKVIVDSSVVSPDTSIVTYVYLLSKIEKESRERTGQLHCLESKLKSMEEILRGVQDVKYKIFVMHYLDNLSAKQIGRKLCYSRRHIERILKGINNDVAKCRNSCDMIKE